jgi:hypothetical protein
LKFLEKYTGANTSRYGYRNEHLHRIPTTQKISARIKKWDYIKLKIFCASKDTITRVMSQSTE